MLWAQISGAEDAIKAAAASREGWVAVLLVVLVLATYATFAYVVRTVMKEARDREKESQARTDALDAFVRTTLVDALKQNSAVMSKMLEAAEAMIAAATEMSRAIAHCRGEQTK
jgi:uncharacterized protein YlxP (DUF503 family)